MDDYDRVRNIAMRAGLTAGITGVSSALLFGDTANVNVFNINIPAYALIGLSSGVGSAVSDTVHEYALPHVPQDERLMRIEALALDFVASGVSTATALYFGLNLQPEHLPKAVILGGISKLGSNYTWDNILDSQKEGFIL